MSKYVRGCRVAKLWTVRASLCAGRERQRRRQTLVFCGRETLCHRVAGAPKGDGGQITAAGSAADSKSFYRFLGFGFSIWF